MKVPPDMSFDASKVGLIILGAQKCSTTTLFELLKNHPQMCPSRVKETNFFTSSENWKRDLPLYEGLFDPKPGQLLFEASTTYTFYPLRRLQIWEEMYQYNRNLKFIYLVRNPIDRIISAYMHQYLRGYSDHDIHATLKTDMSLLTVSRYYTQVIPFVRQFGRDRVLIIDVDQLHSQRESTLSGIAEFLNIRADELLNQPSVHVNRSLDNKLTHRRWDNPRGVYKLLRVLSPKLFRRLSLSDRRTLTERPSLTPSEKKMIIDVLDLEIDQLEKLMDRSLQHWKCID